MSREVSYTPRTRSRCQKVFSRRSSAVTVTFLKKWHQKGNVAYLGAISSIKLPYLWRKVLKRGENYTTVMYSDLRWFFQWKVVILPRDAAPKINLARYTRVSEDRFWVRVRAQQTKNTCATREKIPLSKHAFKNCLCKVYKVKHRDSRPMFSYCIFLINIANNVVFDCRGI